MTPIEVKEYFVTWRNAMRKAGLSENAYGAWLRNGYIPMCSQIKLENASGGALKAKHWKNVD
jgi:hypothetical protein